MKLLKFLSILFLGSLAASAMANFEETTGNGRWSCQFMTISNGKVERPTSFNFEIIDNGSTIFVKQDKESYYYAGDFKDPDTAQQIGTYLKTKGNMKSGTFMFGRGDSGSTQEGAAHYVEIFSKGDKPKVIRSGMCFKD